MIVAHAPKTYFGSDKQKTLGSLPGFPWAKYPGEKHNYTGPVGDRVRIFKCKSKFEKGYVGYWTDEIFIVDKVNTTAPPTYELIDQDKEQIIETKKPNTTAWINKAKPYFVDQIGDTLQVDLDMNNFKVTYLKSPENDNDAVHKKYLREQINSIEVNKNHLEDKISNVKRFFKRQLNNKNVVNETKLQQEDKIAKQKLDIQQLIDKIPDENEDTFQQELNALETKLNSELQKELRNIQQQIQNRDDSKIKTYIQQQIQNIDDNEIKTYIQQQIQNIDDSVIQQQLTTINNLVLKQDKNIVALEKQFKQEYKAYYFTLPFGSLSDKDASVTDNIDRSKDYEYKKYGFTANIRVYSPKLTSPFKIFNSQFLFFEKILIEIIFPIQFLRATDFEYVKLYFVTKSFSHEDSSSTDLFTSIDIHKSQQGKQFIIFSSIIERNDGIEVGEIADNYDENVWRICRDDNAIKQVSPLELNVFPTIHDDCLYAWDCETYSEKKAIPYSCTLINLEKLRKMLDRIKHNFPDLNPTDNVPEEFYDKLMNIVEIFVGKDCIDQMLQRLGKIEKKE
ncbi:hypothetical protein LOTGIDRAFT_161035 [Lottia gigantea]|uniref:Uncharacterized protein n=1 Tax=Lottia gigantea TaxID=225164 RepID=V4C036_LOTGI|nr:hypothetical protein LOTGIDRAFT_161035 [Lottia gigantea]ESO94784.1 hypothetical protein LOTGIDRAFT_161035 [Lottia gigantea]